MRGIVTIKKVMTVSPLTAVTLSLALGILSGLPGCRAIAGYRPGAASDGRPPLADADGGPVPDTAGNDARPPQSRPQELALGSAFSCVLMTSGDVLCWGENVYGIDGEGVSGRPLSLPDPFQVAVKSLLPPAKPTERHLAAGEGHVCGISVDVDDHDHHELVCWGLNDKGQADPSNTDPGQWKVKPAAIALPEGAEATSLALGAQHSCALAKNGRVYCWGDNSSGQLGAALPKNAMPQGAVLVANLANVTALGCGDRHCCAFGSSVLSANNKGVYCWGANDQGQLGQSGASGASAFEPVEATNVELSAVTDLACGQNACCAATNTSDPPVVLCWGEIAGADPMSSTTMQWQTQGERVTEVSVGQDHACARSSLGKIWCVGENLFGQLGVGPSLGDRATTVRGKKVSTLDDKNVRDIDLGNSHSCAITKDGDVYCWGRNRAGQVGNGHQARRAGRGQAVLTGTSSEPITGLASGAYDSCAIVGSKLRCWGFNGFGYQDPISKTMPLWLSPPGFLPGMGTAAENPKILALGAFHACVVSEKNDLSCWGINAAGQTGSDPKLVPVVVPAPQVSLPSGVGVASVAAGQAHSCALDTKGGVWCWGSNDVHQLGGGGASIAQATSTPTPVTSLKTGNKTIVARGNATCVINAQDKLRCWGDNSSGQLGTKEDPTATWIVHPTDPKGSSDPEVAAVTLGVRHGCAMAKDKKHVYCWGEGAGNGMRSATDLPREVPFEKIIDNDPIKLIAAGAFFTCASTDAGRLFCWGGNFSHELGQPQLASALPFLLWSQVPVEMAMPPGSEVVAIAPGWEHVCVLVKQPASPVTHAVHCWGNTIFGQLGDGDVGDLPEPVKIELPTP